MMIWALLGCGRLQGEVTLALSERIPTVVRAAFPVGAADQAAFRVELKDGLSLRAEPERIVQATIDDGVARAPLVGLKAGRRYRVVGVADGEDRAEGEVETGAAPDVLRFQVDALDPDRAQLARGYVGMALDTVWSGVVVVDGEGDPVWWWEPEPGWDVSAPRPTADGRALVWIEGDEGRDQRTQRLVRTELDGSVRSVWEIDSAHHMAAELDGGEFAWPVWDIREVPWEDGEVAPVLGDSVAVGVPGAPVRTVFSFFDDRGPPYVPCAHGLARDERLGQPVYEWTHLNSVIWVPERDVLVLVSRLMDALLEIDRQTGEVNWQLGGERNTVSMQPPSGAFSHGHASDAWDGGMLLFDNGSHHEPRTSRVLEYAIDAQSQTVELVWEHPAPDDGFFAWLGDARRLPEDHVLIAWSTGSLLEEVDRDHEVLWRISGPDGATVGRVFYMSSLDPR
jgi:hypothetical protein